MKGFHNIQGRVSLAIFTPGLGRERMAATFENLVVDEHTEILARIMSGLPGITHVAFEFTNSAPESVDEALVDDSASIYDSQPEGADIIIAPLIARPLLERISSTASRVTYTATTAAAGGTGVFGLPWGDGSYLTHMGLLAVDGGYGSGRRLFSRTRVSPTGIAKPSGFDISAHWQITFQS